MAALVFVSMCGRFALTLPTEAVARLFSAVPDNDLPETPNFNICPTNSVAVLVSADGHRRVRAARWGFVPHWYKTPGDGPLLINARAETLAEKPAFRDACRTRRCLVPATGFYEWTKDAAGNRLPWYIAPPDGSPIAFAGIWQTWEREGQAMVTCAIVTTAANATMSALHHRMPLAIAPRAWPLWLGEGGKGAARLMVPAPEEQFAFHRVDPKVNSNRAHGPDLIVPLSGAKKMPPEGGEMH